MTDASSYYYQRLGRREQQAYHDMLEGLSAIRPSFPVPRLEGRVLSDIYFMLRMDHPEIFYTVTFKYRYFDDSEKVTLIPEYIFPKAKIIEHRQALMARAARLARTAEKLSPEEKLLYIHDFICQNIHYDKLKKPYSHEIIGALGHGVAVCEGIAKTVRILCEQLGIWCIVALSEANPEKGIKYRHAWNVVKLGGSYYHLDATFDNSLGSADFIRHDYYKLSDRQLYRDHEPVLWPVPACTDGDHTYYREKKLSFTKKEEVIKRAGQYAKKGRTFLFQWRGGYLTRDLLGEFIEEISTQAAAKGRTIAVSVNLAQAVVRVRFEKEAQAETLILEQANEGETETDI